MSTMRALVLHTVGEMPRLTEMPRPEPRRGETLVSLAAAALNHRDLFIAQGLYAGIRLPCILGSDGAGWCDGRPVLIYPARAWGGSQAVQGPQFRVLGMPDAGTFAEYHCASLRHVFPVPDGLSMQQAAALPLAGLTAWRALKYRGRLRAGMRVLITGIGGGVALMAMQLALAAGAKVWVTSGQADKLARAQAMGAEGGVLYSELGWDKRLRSDSGGGFHLVLDSAGGDGFALLPGLALPGGSVVTYGGTLGKINGLSPQVIFWKQVTVAGSTMGSLRDFKQMLHFVGDRGVVPVVDAVFPLERGAEAFERLQRGEQFGKVTLAIG